MNIKHRIIVEVEGDETTGYHWFLLNADGDLGASSQDKGDRLPFSSAEECFKNASKFAQPIFRTWFAV